jgi:SSS family solute:Na+ symporter
LLIVIIYLVVILYITLLQRRTLKLSVFRADKKVNWWVSGLSLYMFYLSVDQGQLLTGIIAEHGMKGMWMIWAGWLGTFVIPIVFAPLWQKMDFLTDNQFLLFRYPGKSGKYLHLFRAVYVGGLVVALSLCFHVLGFARVLEVFFNIPYASAVGVTGLILALFSLKNVFNLKIKMDVIHAILYFVSLAIIIGALFYETKGSSDFLNFFKLHPDKAQIIPRSSSTSEWFSLFVFMGVQWWSCYLFDGGGPEMSRFTAVKGKRSAILTGLLPISISFVLSFVMMGLIFLLLGRTNHDINPDLYFVESVLDVVPEMLQGLVVLGFFGMFITTAESLLNWGGSFLTIDVIKGYVKPQLSERQWRFLSFGSMLLLSLGATSFALGIDSLERLVKITFSISAGVAPVYILRWVWFRINAWTQLSAMLSSAVCTLLYPSFHDVLPLRNYPMEESRVLAVTVITTVIWFVVTFLTPNKSAEVRMRMMPVLQSRKVFFKRFMIAVFLGAAFLTITVVCWRFVLN